jgi:hypothetical protein
MQFIKKNLRFVFGKWSKAIAKRAIIYLSLFTLRLTRGELIEGLEKFPRFPNLRGREASPPKKKS